MSLIDISILFLLSHLIIIVNAEIHNKTQDITAPSKIHYTWISSEPCNKQLTLKWAKDGRVNRYLIENYYFLPTNEKNSKQKWKKLKKYLKGNCLTLNDQVLGVINKIKICSEINSRKKLCSEIKYLKVPKYSGTFSSHCKEMRAPLPAEIEKIKIIETDFLIKNENLSIRIKWEWKGSIKNIKNFVVKINKKVQKIAKTKKELVIHVENRDEEKNIKICAEDLRKKLPNICSKQKTLKLMLTDNPLSSVFVAPKLIPEKKIIPPFKGRARVNKLGEVLVSWKYPTHVKRISNFKTNIFKNCDNKQKMIEIATKIVANSGRSVKFKFKDVLKGKCGQICVDLDENNNNNNNYNNNNNNNNINEMCSLIFPISSKEEDTKLTVHTSNTKETSTYIILEGVLELGSAVRILCIGEYKYYSSKRKYKTKQVHQLYTYIMDEYARDPSLHLTGLTPNTAYSCRVDAQSESHLYYSTTTLFNTYPSSPAPPHKPVLLEHTLDSFTMELLPSSTPSIEYYQLIAIPYSRYGTVFQLYANASILQIEPSGVKPNSIAHPIIASNSDKPIPFIVHTIPSNLLPRRVTIGKLYSPYLWKADTKYRFMLTANMHSTMNNRLLYSYSKLTQPVLINQQGSHHYVRGEKLDHNNNNNNIIINGIIDNNNNSNNSNTTTTANKTMMKNRFNQKSLIVVVFVICLIFIIQITLCVATCIKCRIVARSGKNKHYKHNNVKMRKKSHGEQNKRYPNTLLENILRENNTRDEYESQACELYEAINNNNNNNEKNRNSRIHNTSLKNQMREMEACADYRTIADELYGVINNNNNNNEDKAYVDVSIRENREDTMPLRATDNLIDYGDYKDTLTKDNSNNNNHYDSFDADGDCIDVADFGDNDNGDDDGDDDNDNNDDDDDNNGDDDDDNNGDDDDDDNNDDDDDDDDDNNDGDGDDDDDDDDGDDNGDDDDDDDDGDDNGDDDDDDDDSSSHFRMINNSLYSIEM